MEIFILLISFGVSILLVRWNYKRYEIMKRYDETKIIDIEETSWDIFERRKRQWSIIFFFFYVSRVWNCYFLRNFPILNRNDNGIRQHSINFVNVSSYPICTA